MKIEFEIFLPQAQEGRTFSFQIVDSLDRPVAHIWRYDQDKPFLRGKGLQKVVCEIPNCRLNIGHFSLRTFLAGPPGKPADQVLEGVCNFEVVIYERSTLFGWRQEVCAYHEEADWTETPI